MTLWFKALHLIAMVTWFAALFYLPRLYVYHAMARDRGEQQAIDHFLVMERKLYRGIMTPSMIAVLLFGGGLLVLNPGWLTQGWIHAKLLLVALMFAHYIVAGRWLKGLDKGGRLPASGTLRWFNEIPVFLLLAVIWLVLAKPF